MRSGESASDDARKQPPWNHERYEPLGLLGRGTFGDVYLARDLLRGHDVALKVLRHWDSASVAQLRKEFRALKHLDHPNLVALYELHADDRDGFITMEVVHGSPVVDYAHAAADGDERRARIRHCLAQLVDAVVALHARGTLHRDLKPSNALVTASGRLVVLDAGLAKSMDAQRSSQHYVCGTPGYMSPEQALGEALGAASDWYSVGVIAYELHARSLPFENHPWGLLRAKVTAQAPSIAEASPHLPAADVRMIDGLLRRDPHERPDSAALREWLSPERRVSSDVPFAKNRGPTPLVGRHAELEHLDRALAAARENGLAVTPIVGASGIGKTALVRHWLDGLEPSEEVQLLGRCYQRETVLFSGFEDIFETIAKRFANERPSDLLRADEMASIELVLGQRLALRGSNGIEAAIRSQAAPPDPLERRRLVGRALARLVAMIVGDATLVIWLDDLQWGGIETAMLLSDIAHARFPRGCLLVLSHRPPGPEDGACVATLRQSLEFTHPLELGPLPPRDAAALVERFAGAARLSPDDLGRLVLDAAGHPLLLEQATRHLAEEGVAGSRDLGAILAARIARLPAEAKTLLCVLAVAAEPLPDVTVLAAAGLGPDSGATRALLAADLARRVGRAGHCLVPFHDQLRDAVAAELSNEERRRINVALADALERSGQGQPEALVGYYLAAGERRRAAQYVSTAATHMAQALAFDRAAKLFRISLDLSGELGKDETERVRLGLADALVNSGRVEEGARLRLEVAARKGGRAGDVLTNQAASELIRAGRVDEGLRYARRTLATLGLRLSESGLRALPSIALDRSWLGLRGMRHRIRPASSVPPLLLERVDWCQSLSMVLPLFDTLRGFQIHNQGLRWALEAGEPARLGQALAMEAGFQMALGGGRDASGKVEELLQTARMLADGSGNARARGVVEIIVGSTRWSAGDWTGCVRHIEEGVATLRRHCTGVSWEVNFGQTHALDALAWMGELRKKREVLVEELAQARARGDLYAETMYTLRDLPTLHLVEDRVEDARACSRALAKWPNRGFQVEHMADLYKQTEVDLYEGRGANAERRVESDWRRLSRSQLMRLQPFRIELQALRGRAAVAAAAERVPGSERNRLVRVAARIASEIDREAPSVRGVVFGATVAAGVASLEGDPGSARRRLEAGIRAAAASGMRLHEQAMRHELGRLTGGDVGREAVGIAESWMRSEGMRRPDLYVRMLCPGLDRAAG